MYSTSYLIKQIGEKLTNLLLEKNADYGDSATQGDAIFATKKNITVTQSSNIHNRWTSYGWRSGNSSCK